MVRSRTKICILACLGITCCCIFLSLKTTDKTIGVDNAVSLFRQGTVVFGQSAQDLKSVVSLLNNRDTNSVVAARTALKRSRLDYKKISFLMDYFFESSSMIYNRPAKTEVDEPYMEYQEPSGFQVMEALLYDNDPAAHRKELMEQAELLSSSAADLNALLYGFKGSDEEMLESVRLELVRVITLSITGYDAPELKSGIEESYQSVLAIQLVLRPYLEVYGKKSAGLAARLAATLTYLKAHSDFDSFDRMQFLTQYALPLQEDLRDLINSLQLSVNHKSILNYEAQHIFSRNAISLNGFAGLPAANAAKFALGKKLFTEKMLSGNQQRSCASCHRPAQYFTDGLKTSIAFDGQSSVARNAPGLLYAGLQHSQFWDGSAKTLPEQIKRVIANPLEMNGDHVVVIGMLRKNESYTKEFAEAFPECAGSLITLDNLSEALTAYIAGLVPMDSPFDAYLAGDHAAMSASQVKGFNLFMGKGQCGSCHFAPLFNGLIPPFYKRTEYEILGTPGNDDFDHLRRDTDPGRYGFFPISYYQAAFKTPTVRNSAKTSPYMHNGAFTTLEKVVEFYNEGGGAGLKMDYPLQTLSAKKLHLSKDEVKNIVQFMQSLTDRMD